MSAANRWTAARARALGTMARHDGIARVSNVTDPAGGTVYWQSADWLVAEGLAEHVGSSGSIALTYSGWAAVALFESVTA